MVVLDEVHYLQDPYRGSVWEEVLVLTPPGVTFVSLSATVSNASDFGAWLTSVRGPTKVVVETHRPVTLHHHFAVAERGSERLTVLPLLRGGKANPDGTGTGRAAPSAIRRHRFRVPRRTEVIEYLAAAGHAARHHLHLLAGRLRRRHPPVPAGRHPADHAGRAAAGSGS